MIDQETVWDIESLLSEIKTSCGIAGGVVDAACPDLFVEIEDYLNDINHNCKRIMDIIQEELA
jgi:hypothetical protein